jgi:hypothetical protein
VVSFETVTPTTPGDLVCRAARSPGTSRLEIEVVRYSCARRLRDRRWARRATPATTTKYTTEDIDLIDPVQIFWSGSGINMPSLDPMGLVHIHDADAPHVRMPARILAIDTPEVTARTEDGAHRVDQNLAQLAEWITDWPDEVPISRRCCCGCRARCTRTEAKGGRR